MNGRSNENKTILFDDIEGEIHATKNKKQAQDEQLLILAYTPNGEKNIILADSTGKFTLTTQHLKTGKKDYIYLKPIMNTKKFEPRISNISDPFQIISEIRKTKKIKYPLSERIVMTNKDTSDIFVEAHENIKLEAVTIKGRGTPTFRDKYIQYLDSLAKSDITIENKDYVCRYRVLNCKTHPNRGNSEKPIVGNSYFHNRNPYKLFVYLEPKYTKEDTIAYIEKYIKPFTEEELLKINKLKRVKAYYPQREFYHPNYDKESIDSLSYDFRNNLTWEPSITTNEKGEATVEFFCSDINTFFVGRIEGLSNNGELGSESFEFSVLKIN